MEKAILRKPDHKIETLKSIAKEIKKGYTNNIKIEINVDNNVAKINVTEYNK